MTNDLCVIYGAGGHSRVVAALVQALGWRVHGFYDDSFAGLELIQGAPVRGTFAAMAQALEVTDQAAIALGDSQRRQEAFFRVRAWGFRLPAFVHPWARIEREARVGDGAIVCLGAMVGTQAVVGQGAIVNTGAIIDHESCLGDFSHLAPGVAVAGRTKLGARVFVGMNACVADGLHVGDDAVIGAGSVVLADVPAGAKILGVYTRSR